MTMPNMPYSGGEGTLLRITRTGDDSFDRTVLGSFESWGITFNQRLEETTGPKDTWEFHKPLHLGWTATITRWVPSTDATPSDDEGSAADDDIGSTLELVTTDDTVIVFQGKNGNGDYVTGDVHWESLALAMSDAADKETLSFKGNDEPTITKG
jgi:hypothetical protein